ncbi:VOC family protein [Nocardioides sp.]|uniref:VOC family protein n=1 Tax=Nocardioides sp. TaxID=35761 RepID=UPI0027185A48|nr:VOC family protein [Nocardioides sp.]MDO9454502.1 VOC family protein [Nocardioides sp.]
MAPLALVGLRLDVQDVRRMASFWADVLGWRAEDQEDGAVAVLPDAPSGYPLMLRPGGSSKSSQNRIHFDLTTGSMDEMQQLISHAYSLGATDGDIGQSPDEPHTVLVDPEGNEFCVIPPGSTFLANTGAIGAINCDGSQAVGYFWSDALGWPLVWDQDEETAIQSPEGGSKVTWSGPPLMPREGRDRLRFELSTSDSISGAIEHLKSLGAHVEEGPVSSEAVLRDPDGNEFHLVAMRRMR